jgi:hypothetical protein
MEQQKTMGSSKTPGENSNEDSSEATAVDIEGGLRRFEAEKDGKLIWKYFLEFENVSAEIDNLNTVLDNMESQADNIKDQLMSILMSNREILQELKAENQKAEESKDGASPAGSDEKQMDTS